MWEVPIEGASRKSPLYTSAIINSLDTGYWCYGHLNTANKLTLALKIKIILETERALLRRLEMLRYVQMLFIPMS